MDVQAGDVLHMKKPHPCGCRELLHPEMGQQPCACTQIQNLLGRRNIMGNKIGRATIKIVKARQEPAAVFVVFIGNKIKLILDTHLIIPLCLTVKKPSFRMAYFWLPKLDSNQRPCG